ncbi:hypothetical protein DAEQUDRAFT_809150 [Daedalea quercina L-15889]|uniref:Uncharacterized protein n=1 Tax=Daedalea quercina L-15889 TaxID=1314783 RepID=A0A165SND4_9APHY|nr:hypothetical protein DAEQUDRAFT_809150 [Daedalea quercina L-15889]
MTTRDLHGLSFLSPSRRMTMTDEPRPINSPSSPFLLIDQAAARSLAAARSRSTTDIRQPPNGNYPLQNGAASKDGVQVRTGVPVRNWTQTDQDETDAENRQRAMKELMKSWMDRLQLISVITTFFAAMESQLLVITTPSDDTQPKTPPRARALDTANTILAGALVIHLCAAIISFLAAFFLVRYRLKEATKAEIKIETGITPTSTDGNVKASGIFTTNPHLEEIGPFRRGGPPTRLLEHLHALCMWLAVVGFALALAGALAYTWSRLSRSAGIFASTCLGVAWLAAVAAFIVTL